jgi:large subunit ribosomal protein L13
MMKTYSVKPGDIKRETHVVDAADKILGRMATEIASLLMGKHKAMFSRRADVGDCVTVINAAKVQVTGKKPVQKLYYRHSNYPGGFREITYERMMAEHPDRIVIFAVDGMLPMNHLHDRMMKRLKVYAGEIPPLKIKVGKPSTKKAGETKAAPKKKAEAALEAEAPVKVEAPVKEEAPVKTEELARNEAPAEPQAEKKENN